MGPMWAPSYILDQLAGCIRCFSREFGWIMKSARDSMQKFKRSDSVLRCTFAFECRYRLVVCYQKTCSRPLMFLRSCLLFSLFSLESWTIVYLWTSVLCLTNLLSLPEPNARSINIKWLRCRETISKPNCPSWQHPESFCACYPEL